MDAHDGSSKVALSSIELEYLGQRLRFAGRRYVPNHALACGGRLWRGLAKVHGRRVGKREDKTEERDG